MVAINHHTSNTKNSDYSQYSINTWSSWCKKNDIDFIVIDKNNNRYNYPVWNKDTIFDIIGDKYDKIGYVDSDTMIKWDAPNPFDLYDDEWCGVVDSSSLRWIYNSINLYKVFYPDVNLDTDNYINSGVSFFTKEHKFIYDNLIKLYEENTEQLDDFAKKGCGKVQTLLNYELTKNNVKMKILSPSWNLVSIHKKEMFTHNWQLNEDETPFFMKYAHLWHFTGFNLEDRVNVMRKIWEALSEKYD